jgi:hypothetical protein
MDCRRVAFAFVPLVVIMGCGSQNASAPARTAAVDSARPGDQSGFAIVKLDPALDTILSSDATLETVGDRFGLTEGPVWARKARARISCSVT